MSLEAARARALAERKARLVAASEGVRRDLVAQLPAGDGLEGSGARLASAAAALLRRQPLALAVVAFVVAATGPRRVFGALRWAAVTLPLHPMGRRLLGALGERLFETLSRSGASATRRPRA